MGHQGRMISATRRCESARARANAPSERTRLLAKARGLCPPIEFIEWDLARGLPPLEGPFDRILANMVLMDVQFILIEASPCPFSQC